MTARGYDAEFAERTFKQLEGFGSYGFPGEPCGVLRQDRLCLVLDEVPPSGRVLLRHPQRAADGLLRAGPARAGCAGPWRRESVPSMSTTRAGTAPWSRRRTARRFAVRLGLRMVHGLANADGGLIPIARGETPVLVDRGSLAARRDSGHGPRTPGRGRRLRLARRQPPRCALDHPKACRTR